MSAPSLVYNIPPLSAPRHLAERDIRSCGPNMIAKYIYVHVYEHIKGFVAPSERAGFQLYIHVCRYMYIRYSVLNVLTRTNMGGLIYDLTSLGMKWVVQTFVPRNFLAFLL